LCYHASQTRPKDIFLFPNAFHEAFSDIKLSERPNDFKEHHEIVQIQEMIDSEEINSQINQLKQWSQVGLGQI
jgi:hypothetical protein